MAASASDPTDTRSSAAAEFLREFLAQHNGSGTSRLADRYEIEPARRWAWGRIARPYGNPRLATRAQFGQWPLGYLRRDLEHARGGNVGDPLKAALDVLRDVRNEVRLTVDDGGLTGRSYRDELQNWYTPFNAFVSIGPPARRIEEMIALLEAGLLVLVGPDMWAEPAPDGGFLLGSGVIPEEPVHVDVLIEAMLPEVDIRRCACRKLRPRRSSGISILVNDSAETVLSA